MIPLVAASERGAAQTARPFGEARGCRTASRDLGREPNGLERPTKAGDSPVGEAKEAQRDPEYRGARETLWESAGTIRQG